MSLQMRHYVADHPHIVYTNRESQRADFLDESKVKSTLIALLADLLGKGHIILVTCLFSDHHVDGGLGPHSHNPGGVAIDCWPLKSTKPTDFLDATDSRFHAFLHDIAGDKYEYQIGLGGSCAIREDFAAAGSTAFADNGSDHVHIGAKTEAEA
jgi:hypothetical protein